MLILLVVVQFVLIAIFSSTRTKSAARAVKVGFVLLVGLPILSVVVVTEREQVIGLCRELADLIDKGNVGAIGPHLAEDFQAGGYGKTEVLDRLQSRLTKYRMDDPSLRNFKVVFPSKTEAELTFDASCSIRSADQYLARVPSRWKVKMRKHGSEWLVTSVEALPTPLSPIRDLHDWLP